MRSKSRVLLAVSVAVVLGACAGAAAPSDSDSQEAGAVGSPVTQLIVGTLTLEGSDLAVLPEQAAELSVLWKAYRSLTQSDTASDAEIQAVLGQIRQQMTAAQLAEIESIDLSSQSAAQPLQDFGFQPEAFQGETGFAGEQAGTRPEGGFGGGDGPPTGFAGGGGPPLVAGDGEGIGPLNGFPGGAAGAELSPDQVATLQASQGGSRGDRLSLRLLEPLIQLLEQRAAE